MIAIRVSVDTMERRQAGLKVANPRCAAGRNKLYDESLAMSPAPGRRELLGPRPLPGRPASSSNVLMLPWPANAHVERRVAQRLPLARVPWRGRSNQLLGAPDA